MNACVWRVNEHCLEILNVLVQPFGSPPIWPMHDDVLCMTVVKSPPILMRQDVQIQCV